MHYSSGLMFLLSGMKQDAGVLKKTSELESLVSQQETQIQEYRRVLSQTVSRKETYFGVLRMMGI